LNKKITIGNVYIPPKNSIYSNIELFSVLEREITTRGTDDTYIILCGDFNAHTGTRTDIISFDDYMCEAVGIDSVSREALDFTDIMDLLGVSRIRASVHASKDRLYGNRLLDLCQNMSLLMAVWVKTGQSAAVPQNTVQLLSTLLGHRNK